MNKSCIILFIVFILLITCDKVMAQPYLRLYDASGKRIARGKLLSTTDSTIEVSLKGMRKSSVSRAINIAKVDCIKTNRSWTSYSLAGFGMGLFTAWMINIPLDKLDEVSDDKNIEKAMGVIFITGMSAGTVIGTVVGLARKREKFIINGNPEKWNRVRCLLESMPKDELDTEQ